MIPRELNVNCQTPRRMKLHNLNTPCERNYLWYRILLVVDYPSKRFIQPMIAFVVLQSNTILVQPGNPFFFETTHLNWTPNMKGKFVSASLHFFLSFHTYDFITYFNVFYAYNKKVDSSKEIFEFWSPRNSEPNKNGDLLGFSLSISPPSIKRSKPKKKDAASSFLRLSV